MGHHLDSQPRLANPAGADKGQQATARIIQEVGDLADLVRTTYERCPILRQVMRSYRSRPHPTARLVQVRNYEKNRLVSIPFKRPHTGYEVSLVE